jgi:hypothetical protein
MGGEYSAGDRLLFWLSDKTGLSIDQVYASRLVRAAMMLADKFGGKASKDPL